MMKLDEWAQIPESQRRDIIIRWYKADRWSHYEKLALRALKSLRTELASIPEIALIELTGGALICPEDPLIRFCELTLTVCTLLADPFHIDSIPSRFFGFPVRQVNLGDKRESFIRTWIWLFKGLKDWDEIQTRTWAKQWDDTLKSSISPFYSWGPVKVAVPSLVDRNIINVATGDIQGLYDDIRKAITEGAEPGSSEMQHPDRIAGFDWDEVREQVRSFIEKHARENK